MQISINSASSPKREAKPPETGKRPTPNVEVRRPRDEVAKEWPPYEQFVTTMKTKLAALIVALLSICLVARPSVMAIGISIEIGDRPYYDGPFFWDEGYYWVWIPGHWEDHHWIHGHYVRQGVFHIEHKYEH